MLNHSSRWGGGGNNSFLTYYPSPLSPRPCAIMTVDLCSVMAGNITAGGICANIAGSPTEEVILRKACIELTL